MEFFRNIVFDFSFILGGFVLGLYADFFRVYNTINKVQLKKIKELAEKNMFDENKEA